MKNKKIYTIILIMIVLIIMSISYYNKYYYATIDKSIMDNKWYKYNPLTGYYDTISFEEDSFVYNTNYKDNDYQNCTNYVYDKKNKILNLNCNKKIKINSISKNKLELTLDSKKVYFYSNIEDTMNYEFENYYKKNLSEYKKEMNRVKDLTKINYKSLLEVMSQDEYSKIFIISDNCSSIECALVLGTIEKLMSKENNIYYLDMDDIKDNELIYLNKITNKFSIDRSYYDGVYPKVIVTNKNNIIDEYDFKCNGLNCDKYLESNN